MLEAECGDEESAQVALAVERVEHASRIKVFEAAEEESKNLIDVLEKAVAEDSRRRDDEFREIQRKSLETFRESLARAVELLEKKAEAERLTAQREFHKAKRNALAELLREARRQADELNVENANLKEAQDHDRLLAETERLSSQLGKLEQRVQELEEQNAELSEKVFEAGTRTAELETEKSELAVLLHEEQTKLTEAGKNYDKAQHLLRRTHLDATRALVDLQQKAAKAQEDERSKVQGELHDVKASSQRALQAQRESFEQRMAEVMNMHAITVKERDRALRELDEAQKKANAENVGRLETQRQLDATCSELPALRSELEAARTLLEKAQSELEMFREYGDHRECTEVYRTWRLERERLQRELRVLTLLNEKLGLRVALVTAVSANQENTPNSRQEELAAVQTLIGSVVRAVQEEALSPRKRHREDALG